VQVFARGLEAICSYLKSMDNQEYIQPSDISQMFELTHAHCLRDLVSREEEMRAADAAEWVMTFICMHGLANAKSKLDLGNAGACELVGDLLRKFVLVNTSDAVLDEAQVAYSNRVAKIVSYAAGNLCQNKTLDNKKKLRDARVCEALTALVGNNEVILDPKVKDMALKTVTKINDNTLLKFSSW
jgi:TATA-binding protein-associated factor Taf7